MGTMWGLHEVLKIARQHSIEAAPPDRGETSVMAQVKVTQDQGGKRPGGETGSPLLGQCVMRRRTGTSAPSALPVQLMAAKNLLSTNRK